jgi:hypothetical protein
MNRSKSLFLMTIATTTAVLGGCDNPRQDVRLTLCKDMVAVSLGAAPSWTESKIETHGYQGAVVSLRFTTEGAERQASCFYKYDAVDDTALTLANPIEAYSTSPYKMILDGRTIAGSELARAVKLAMQKQGREFVNRARDAVQGRQ